MKYIIREDWRKLTADRVIKACKTFESEHPDTSSVHWFYSELKEIFIYNISQGRYTLEEITQISQAINNIKWVRYKDGEVVNQLKEDLIS